MRRIWTTISLVGLLLVGLAGTAAAQRSPELNVQFHRAETAFRSGASMLEAKARVDRVLNVVPDDVEALKLRAEVLLELDRVDEALADARRAVRLRANDGEAHLILCEAARRSGDTALALRALDAAAALALDDAALHVKLSWNAVLLERLDEAEAFARVAWRAEPSLAAAHYQLARIFVLKNQPDAAASVLAGGLREALLDPGVIAADTVLTHVAEHPTLRALLNR